MLFHLKHSNFVVSDSQWSWLCANSINKWIQGPTVFVRYTQRFALGRNSFHYEFNSIVFVDTVYNHYFPKSMFVSIIDFEQKMIKVPNNSL